MNLSDDVHFIDQNYPLKVTPGFSGRARADAFSTLIGAERLR